MQPWLCLRGKALIKPNWFLRLLSNSSSCFHATLPILVMVIWINVDNTKVIASCWASIMLVILWEWTLMLIWGTLFYIPVDQLTPTACPLFCGRLRLCGTRNNTSLRLQLKPRTNSLSQQTDGYIYSDVSKKHKQVNELYSPPLILA